MNSVQMVVLSACAISIIVGIVQTIKPSGKYDRQLRLFTACLMLIGILSPLFESVKTLSPDWSGSAAAEEYAEQLGEASEEQLLMLAQEEVTAVLRKELAADAIPCSHLSVEMHIDEDERINISSVTVVSTQPRQAEAAVRQYLGKDVEIHADTHS
ncbi:MAG: stage III sporulation protein AF [Ruminococcus sp.]|nr:stage III sporulation protein AF [Ruminococcus sp.]